MESQHIEFRAAGHQRFAAPVPSVREVPEWLKRMSGQMPDPNGGEPYLTIKRCPPFVEAVSFAYLIPAPYDVVFTMDAQGRLTAQSSGEPLTGWVEEQYAGTPFFTTHVVIFPNPWVVRTPPGYSTLFVHPLNRYDFPFRVLYQLVETDTHPAPVTFPAISYMAPGTQFRLAKGTPIAQAIPIKREAWGHAVVPWDAAKQAEQDASLKSNPHLYREEHWERKRYQ